jgi:hypothetical protein
MYRTDPVVNHWYFQSPIDYEIKWNDFWKKSRCDMYSSYSGYQPWNGPRFNSSIFRHSGIFGEIDESVLKYEYINKTSLLGCTLKWNQKNWKVPWWLAGLLILRLLMTYRISLNVFDAFLGDILIGCILGECSIGFFIGDCSYWLFFRRVFLLAGRKRKKSATSNYLISTGRFFIS